MEIMATSGKVASGSKNENLLVRGFLARVDGDIKLSTGKVIKKFKDGWKASDIAKDKASACWAKLTEAERKEIRDHFGPQIEEFKATKKAFKDFTASASSLGRRIYR
uniref:Uncharacterized protein n=1 Tax=viral metagenome TaxID=1070528 RepID=A0A6H1ZGX7_9ZZZZ